MPIHDNHFHCKADGWKGMDAVREFMAAGGTSITHVRLPTYPKTVEQYVQSCKIHLDFSQQIRAETGCNVWSAIGPYPLEPMHWAKTHGWEVAEQMMAECLAATKPFFDSRQAHCLGEVGRPHFDVDAPTWEASNRMLQACFQLANDSGVPIMLHTEHTGPPQMLEFAEMADAAGLPRNRVIKHYCGPLVRSEENHGLIPSIIAGRSNIREALEKQGTMFMLETDYIDEPTRPNVVMPCDTVPKRVKGLMQNGELSLDLAIRIGGEIPRALFER